jgi:hypothetical protein
MNTAMGRRHKTKHKKKQMRAPRTPKSDSMAENTTITSTEIESEQTIDSAIEETKTVQTDNADVGKKTENEKNEVSESNNTDSVKKYLWSGALGSLITIVIIALVAFFIPGFRYSSYYVNEDPSQLMQMLSTNLSEQDSIYVATTYVEEMARRKDAIEDLLEQGVIVSSEDFASSLSGYYNALIAVLAAVLVILNLFGFFAWRSNAADALEQEKRKLSDAINDIDNRLERNLEEVLRKNQVVREKLETYIQRVIDQDNHLSDEEWDKIHMLLEKYKKKEVLLEIKADEQDNDGSIEEA